MCKAILIDTQSSHRLSHELSIGSFELKSQSQKNETISPELEEKMYKISQDISYINNDFKGLDFSKKVYNVLSQSTKSCKGVEELLDLVLPDNDTGQERSILKLVEFINNATKLLKCITPLSVYYQLVVINHLQDRINKIKEEMNSLKEEGIAQEAFLELNKQMRLVQVNVSEAKAKLQNKAVKGSIGILKSISYYLKIFEFIGLTIAKIVKCIFDIIAHIWSLIVNHKDLSLQSKRIEQLNPSLLNSDDPVVKASSSFIEEISKCLTMKDLQDQLLAKEMELPPSIRSIGVWKQKISVPSYKFDLMTFFQKQFGDENKPIVFDDKMVDYALDKERREYFKLIQIHDQNQVDDTWTKAKVLHQFLRETLLIKNKVERNSLQCEKYETIALLVISAVQSILPLIVGFALVNSLMLPVLLEFSFAGAFFLGWLFPSLLASGIGVALYLVMSIVLACLKPNEYGIHTWPMRLWHWIKCAGIDLAKLFNFIKRLIFVIPSEIVNKISSGIFKFNPHFLEDLIANLDEEYEDLEKARIEEDNAFKDYISPHKLKDMGISEDYLDRVRDSIQNLNIDLIPSKIKEFLQKELNINLEEDNKEDIINKIETLLLSSPKKLMESYWSQQYKEEAAATAV